MVTLDIDAIFVKLDKLRVLMNHLEKNPSSNEWQYARLLIRALTQAVSKSKKNSTPNAHRIRKDAPAALQEDWQELVDVLLRKGIKAQRGRGSAVAK